jgi:hypothetical protein
MNRELLSKNWQIETQNRPKIWRKLDGLLLEWKDKTESHIEHRVADIVVGLIVAGEVQYRPGPKSGRRDWSSQRDGQPRLSEMLNVAACCAKELGNNILR